MVPVLCRGAWRGRAAWHVALWGGGRLRCAFAAVVRGRMDGWFMWRRVAGSRRIRVFIVVVHVANFRRIHVFRPRPSLQAHG